MGDCHDDCLKCRITNRQAVCLEGATCDVCRDMSHDFWVPYTRRYFDLRMKLDDVSRRIHDQIMRDAGKIIDIDVDPVTSNEPDKSPQCDVTSSDATAPGSVIGNITLGVAHDEVRIVDGRCLCGWGVKGDPHPICLKCNMKIGRPVCVKHFTCELCARKDERFWVRYMSMYSRRRNLWSKKRRDAYDRLMADANKITVRNAFATPEQRIVLLKRGGRKATRSHAASIIREQRRSTLSEGSKRPTDTCGDDESAAGARSLRSFIMDDALSYDAAFSGDADNEARSYEGRAVGHGPFDPRVQSYVSEANAIDVNVSNKHDIASGASLPDEAAMVTNAPFQQAPTTLPNNDDDVRILKHEQHFGKSMFGFSELFGCFL